jgi:hypothetical protein
MNDKVMLAVAVLGGISEALSLIPAVKANGVVQLILSVIKAIQGKKE